MAVSTFISWLYNSSWEMSRSFCLKRKVTIFAIFCLPGNNLQYSSSSPEEE